MGAFTGPQMPYIGGGTQNKNTATKVVNFIDVSYTHTLYNSNI